MALTLLASVVAVTGSLIAVLCIVTFASNGTPSIGQYKRLEPSTFWAAVVIVSGTSCALWPLATVTSRSGRARYLVFNVIWGIAGCGALVALFGADEPAVLDVLLVSFVAATLVVSCSSMTLLSPQWPRVRPVLLYEIHDQWE